MFQIVKESLSGKKIRVLLLNQNSEILEFDTIEEANDLCEILNANANGFIYTVKVVTGHNSYYNKDSVDAQSYTEHIFRSLSLISEYLEAAREYNVEAEVVYFALKEMKNDNTISGEDAMERGFNQWIK